MMCDRSCSGYWRKGRYLPFDLWRVRLRLSDGLAALIPGPSPASVITHKSTYGQRYLPSPPDPLSRTAGEGANVALSPFCALKDDPAMVCERSPFAADTTVG